MPINIKSGALRIKNKDGNYVDINSFIRGGSVTKESIYEALGGKPVTIEKQLVMTGDFETGLFVLDRIYQDVKNSIDFEDYVFGSIVISPSNAPQDDLKLGQICFIVSVGDGLLCLTLSNACFNQCIGTHVFFIANELYGETNLHPVTYFGPQQYGQGIDLSMSYPAGSGGYVQSDQNFNDILKAGIYKVSLTPIARTIFNIPEQDAGTLLVHIVSKGEDSFNVNPWTVGFQQYTTIHGNRYIRGIETGENPGDIRFDAWKKIPSVIDNLSSTSAVDALSANQGHELHERLNAFSNIGGKSQVTNGPNANDMVDNGFYHIRGGTGFPLAYGFLIVQCGALDKANIKQIFTPANNANQTWIRQCYMGTWTEWSVVYTSKNFHVGEFSCKVPAGNAYRVIVASSILSGTFPSDLSKIVSFVICDSSDSYSRCGIFIRNNYMYVNSMSATAEYTITVRYVEIV